MSRRARKREARRQEMLDVAIGIVEKEGLEGLTIARLAEALDAAVGALYRYFPGKEALLFAMQQQALQDFYDFLVELLGSMEQQLQATGILEDKQLRAQLQIRLLMAAYLEDARLAPARHRLIFEFMSSYEPMMAQENAAEGEGEVMRILSLVSQAVSVLLGQEEDTVETWQSTLLIWALVHGLDHFRKRDRLLAPHLHAVRLLPVAQTNLFRGWGVPSDKVQEAAAWFTTHQETIFDLPTPEEDDD